MSPLQGEVSVLSFHIHFPLVSKNLKETLTMACGKEDDVTLSFIFLMVTWKTESPFLKRKVIDFSLLWFDLHHLSWPEIRVYLAKATKTNILWEFGKFYTNTVQMSPIGTFACSPHSLFPKDLRTFTKTKSTHKLLHNILWGNARWTTVPTLGWHQQSKVRFIQVQLYRLSEFIRGLLMDDDRQFHFLRSPCTHLILCSSKFIVELMIQIWLQSDTSWGRYLTADPQTKLDSRKFMVICTPIKDCNGLGKHNPIPVRLDCFFFFCLECRIDNGRLLKDRITLFRIRRTSLIVTVKPMFDMGKCEMWVK